MNFWLYLFSPLLALFAGSSVLVWAFTDLSMLSAMHRVLGSPGVPIVFLAAVGYAVFLTALDEIAERTWPEPDDGERGGP